MGARTVRFRFTILSQPVAAVRMVWKVPLVLNEELPTVKDSPAQMVRTKLVIGMGCTVRFSVTVLSQPVTEVSTLLKVPEVV